MSDCSPSTAFAREVYIALKRLASIQEIAKEKTGYWNDAHRSIEVYNKL
jgi:hypothetical protein